MTGEITTAERHFTKRGYHFGGILGRGMEGVVYDLGDDVVGKVWFRRRPDELAALQMFYRELGASPSPVTFPEIIEVGLLDGTEHSSSEAVTVERKLTGTTLAGRLANGTVSVEQGWTCVTDLLAALREIPGGLAARNLPVVDEPQALWSGNATWPQALAALIERRTALFGTRLRAAVTDFDAKLARILDLLGSLQPTSTSVIHGDIVPQNILVDDDCHPLALLDWGFLSTAGDPAFEAALAAGLFDMYGPGARESEAALLARAHAAAGYSLERMHLYRAVYAVVTSNVYDPEGRDGHFAWCAASLERDDVVEALSADLSRF
ncbi:MAG: phosphotransferase [Catenulispora sp.]|nr:phosphotransferase [Catenulispora sp.]